MIKSKIFFIGLILLLTFSLLFAAGCQTTETPPKLPANDPASDNAAPNTQEQPNSNGENLQPPALPTE